MISSGTVPTSSSYFAKGTLLGDIQVWHIETLQRSAAPLLPAEVAIATLSEFDTNVWFHEDIAQPTVRNVAEHARRIFDARLEIPVILSVRGEIMDGLHRIAKAYLLGHRHVLAVQFTQDLAPDFVLAADQLYRLTEARDSSAMDAGRVI